MRVTTKFNQSLDELSKDLIGNNLPLRQFDQSVDGLGKKVLYLLVLAETLMSIFFIYLISGLGEGYGFLAAIPYFYLVISYVSLWFFYRGKRFSYFTFTQLLMLLVLPFFMQWVLGGFEASSGIAIWGVISPVGAMMILGSRQSTSWFVLFLGLSIISWVMNDTFANFAPVIPGDIRHIFFMMNLLGVTSILYIVMRYFQSQKAKVLMALEAEQARSEKLLLNVLPKSIVERLKTDRYKIADRYVSVTILFADLVDFTGISHGMDANDLVDLLNMVFSKFDQLAEQYGLEKIKTIGDAYMVVGGVPNARPDHAHAIANMALDINQALSDISLRFGKPLAMRVGINSGAVVAGVIGTSKFSYDLWGDAVNLASRMEQQGIAGQIQVSQSTYDLLKDDYDFELRGGIPVKGQGVEQAFILKSKRVKH